MADIARLTVALYANSAQFTSELQRANRKGETWKKRMVSSFKTVSTVAATTMTAAAASLALVYNQQAALIDQTAKFADRVGISTEALSQLRYASELTGVGQKNLDMSLQRMTRRLAEAAQGTGEAKGAIKELGLSAQELGAMTPDQQLYALADAFKDVDDQSERVRLAFKLFDSEGVGMVNMLAGGAEGLKAMTDEADQLGVTLDRISAAKIEMANDAMYRINAITNSVKQNIAIELAPIVKALADEFVQAAKKAGGLNNIVTEGIYAIGKGASYLNTSFRGWEMILQSVTVSWRYLKVVGMEAINLLKEGVSSIGDTIVQNVAKPLRTLAESLAPYSEYAAELKETLKDLENYKTPPAFTLEDIYPERVKLDAALKEMRALMDAPIPTDAFEDWYTAAKSNIDQLATDYANSVNRNSGALSAGPAAEAGKTGSSRSADAEAARKAAEEQRLRDNVDQMRQSFLSQDQLEYEHWEQRQNTLNEWFQQEYAQAEGNKQLMASLEDRYLQMSQDSHKQYSDNIDQLEKDRAAKQREAYSSLFGDLTGLAKTFAGEQSAIYKVMFAAQKAYSIANSIVAIQTAIAQAAASTTFPENLFAMASVASATAGLVSTIQGTEYHTGGIAGYGADNFSKQLASNEVPAVLQRGEEVITATDPRHRNNLSTTQSGNGGFVWAGNIIINNNGQPVTGSAYMDSDGNVQITLDQVDEYMANGIYKGTSETAQALEMQYGVNRATGLMR